MPPIPRPEFAAHAAGDDERRLVGGLVDQDRRAVGDFINRTHHAVFCLAGRLTRNTDERQDWCHEALIGILDDLRRGRFTYTRPGSFWAWFRKRVWYRLLDEYRRTRRYEQRQVAASALPEGDEPPDPPDPSDPARGMAAVGVRSAVESCLERIAHADQRQALVLLLFEDQTYEGIAEALNCPLNTAKAWIRRGRLALRKCLVAVLQLEKPELER